MKTYAAAPRPFWVVTFLFISGLSENVPVSSCKSNSNRSYKPQGKEKSDVWYLNDTKQVLCRIGVLTRFSNYYNPSFFYHQFWFGRRCRLFWKICLKILFVYDSTTSLEKQVRLVINNIIRYIFNQLSNFFANLFLALKTCFLLVSLWVFALYATVTDTFFINCKSEKSNA